MSKLPAERDISLLHVLPKGFHRIRHKPINFEMLSRTGQPSATEHSPKASRNWFGGIARFFTKKVLPPTSRNWLTNTRARRVRMPLD